MTRFGKGAAAAAVVLVAGAGHAQCPWDCDGSGDGIVGVDDFLAVLAQWGMTGTSCDLGAGAPGTGVDEFLEILAHWGPCPAVPGACCDPGDGSCAVAVETACTGVFGGEGTTCADSDADRIPDAFELGDCTLAAGTCFSGTDPALPDTDFDGIADGDELYGTLGGIDLPGMGADPCHKDLFIETDWVYGPGQPVDRNKLHDNQAAQVVAAFAAAPTPPNPDGTTGVTMHIDRGQPPYGGGNAVADPSGNYQVDVNSFFSAGEFFTIKNANFDPARMGYFHYCVMCDRYGINGSPTTSSGFSELPGNDFIVAMGQYAVGDDNRIGHLVMHELGHNLNLRHGGNQNRNYKPNYNSVMNYWYTFCGADLDDDVVPDDAFDYSHGTNPALDEANLVEAAGVTGFGPGIDWSDDGDALDTVALNVNCPPAGCAVSLTTVPCGTLGTCYDSSCNALTDYNDWLWIELGHVDDADFAPAEVIQCLPGELIIPRAARP